MPSSDDFPSVTPATAIRGRASQDHLREILLLPDDPQTLRFTELLSYKADLEEARNALEAALPLGVDDALWMPLTMHAATAYSRPFLASKVRRQLGDADLEELEPDLRALHRTVRMYRNRTVAHSHSDLLAVMATVSLDDRGVVTNVYGAARAVAMPMVIADRFLDLVEAVVDQLQTMIHPIWLELRQRWIGSVPDQTADWRHAERVDAQDTDFSSQRPRGRNPRLIRYSASQPATTRIELLDTPDLP